MAFLLPLEVSNLGAPLEEENKSLPVNSANSLAFLKTCSYFFFFLVHVIKMLMSLC